MTRTVITGAIVALLGAALAVAGTSLGITTLWPVLLAAAVGLAAGHASLGRVSAYVLGAVVSLAAMAVRAGLLPDVAGAQALALVLGVAVLTLVAALSAGRVPLWAGLAGYAAFAAFYEPLYADAPTAFLSEAPVALVTVLLAGALGSFAVLLSEVLTVRSGAPAVGSDDAVEAVEGGLA